MSTHRILSVGLIGLLLAVSTANGQIEAFITAIEGDTKVLECPTTTSLVEWRKNGWETQAPLIAAYDRSTGTATMKPPWDNGDVSITQDGDVNKLTIKVKHSRDNGITIYCVEGGITRKTVKTFSVTVHIPPTITGLTLDGKSVTGNDIVLRDDTKATFVVIFNAKPSNTPKVTWVTDNTLYGSGFSATLVIPEGSADRTWDGKVLNCTAFTVHGTDSITKTITVNFGPTISKPTEGHLFPVKEGDTFTLTVEYEAKPDVNTYEWFTPDNAANPNPRHTTNPLTLPNIQRSQAGSYRVRVTNSVSESDDKQFKIRVLYGPSADMTKQLSTVICEVTRGVPTDFLYNFFVQRVQGTIVRNLTYTDSKAKYNPTSYQDSGEYSCGVRNEYKGELVGEDVGRVEVTTRSAPFFIDPPRHFLIGQGEHKTIAVKFYSVPKYDSVIWTVNGTSTSRHVGEVDVVLPFHGHDISTQAYITLFGINNATLQSKGDYIVTVTNGVTSISTVVQVNYTTNATITPSTLGFVKPPTSLSFKVGERAELIVGFYSTPMYKSHTWTLVRDTSVLTFNSDTRGSYVRKTDATFRVRKWGISARVYEAVLVIREVTEDSAGVYTLLIVNEFVRNEHSINVNVIQLKVDEVAGSTNVGAIAGGVVGGIVLIIAVAIIVFCCISRHRRRPREDERVTYTHSTKETDADPYLKPVVSHNDVTTPTVPTPESEEGTYIDIIDAENQYEGSTHNPQSQAQYTGMVSTEYYSLPDDGKGKEISATSADIGVKQADMAGATGAGGEVKQADMMTGATGAGGGVKQADMTGATGPGGGVKQADMEKGEYMDMKGSQYYNVPLDSKYENVKTHKT